LLKDSSPSCNLAEKVPVADDITVEADSGGHTDKLVQKSFIQHLNLRGFKNL
jgi:NAD(P)H-dependent flavin oxidoreductase YrpB (nitropropane dioxygenase family)